MFIVCVVTIWTIKAHVSIGEIQNPWKDITFIPIGLLAAVTTIVLEYADSSFLKFVLSLVLIAVGTYRFALLRNRIMVFLRYPEKDTLSELPRTIWLTVEVAIIWYILFREASEALERLSEAS